MVKAPNHLVYVHSNFDAKHMFKRQVKSKNKIETIPIGLNAE